MKNIEEIIAVEVTGALKSLYNVDIQPSAVQIQQTRKEFSGDKTVVVFPFVRYSKKKPEETGTEIGNYLKDNVQAINEFNVIKGFLNIAIDNSYWLEYFNDARLAKEYGKKPVEEDAQTIMIEYSSPNTNKPLHLGHIRNNVLGYSISEIAKALGYKVVKTNIVNDRGIHICKSMLAWQKWGSGETPVSSGKKGDKLVGDYYVRFDREYKKQVAELKSHGKSDEYAKANAPILKEAQEMLRKWEADDKETVELWKTMNQWVYDGFDETYRKLGVDFDIIYYESQTYKLGKKIVLEGLEQGIMEKRGDGSVWANLEQDGLDKKILLRSDGTSVYMTQDIGTAHQRYEQYKFNKHIYVVGNEQDYHFKVLGIILKKLGFDWADNLFHLSYGMVELPEGKMKSREGTVVDADELIEEMVNTARDMSVELGKLDGYTDDEAERIFSTIALGAVKYFILKVDPKKKMLFDPRESIDFNGNTGPFIQYTYARIQSVLRKAADQGLKAPKRIDTGLDINQKETELLKQIYLFPVIVSESWEALNPSVIAGFMYYLAKEYNQYYHEYTILKEPDDEIKLFRLALSEFTGKIIETGMGLLGIHVPERM